MKNIIEINKILNIKPERTLGLGLRDRIARATVISVAPTHFITLSLCQAIKINQCWNGVVWIKGDDIIYEKTHLGFIRSLSKHLCSESSWRYHKPLLRSASVIEGGSGSERNHMHLIIAKPEHVDEDTFRVMVLRTADGNPWVMNGAHSVDIQSINSTMEAVNTAFYNVKRGVERLTLG